MMEVKKDVFGTLDSLVSHDPELRKQNAIRILEIGVGSGGLVFLSQDRVSKSGFVFLYHDFGGVSSVGTVFLFDVLWHF